MLTRDQIIWGYKLLLEREPESQAVIEEKMKCDSIHTLVHDFMCSTEFQDKHPSAGVLHNQWVMIDHALGFRLWVNLADFAISWAIIKNEFETAETSFVQQYVKSGDSVLDIGTNIGFYALLFSKLVGPQGKVIGFEALDFLYDAAVKSVDENGFSHCTIHNVALGSEKGTAQLIYAPGSTNWGGAFLSFDGVGLPDHTAIPIPVAPLSDFLEAKRLDFIKIDVEGAEHLVLSSCIDHINETKPIIMSEIHRQQMQRVSGVEPSAYIAMLNSVGYRCYQIDNKGRLGTPLSGNEDFQLVNVAFVP